MRVCGVDLKANSAIFSVIEKDDDIVIYIDLKVKKIILEDDENRDQIVSFRDDLRKFLNDNCIEKVYIKKRAKKGNFSGGALTFKMEAIIQLNDICDVSLVSSQVISSFDKKNDIKLPNNLKKYQEQAYLTLLASV